MYIHVCTVCEALHSASPELHLMLFEFESASDCEWAMSNIAPHVCDDDVTLFLLATTLVSVHTTNDTL